MKLSIVGTGYVGLVAGACSAITDSGGFFIFLGLATVFLV